MANCSQEEKCQRARALVRQREAIEEEIKSITANLTVRGSLVLFKYLHFYSYRDQVVLAYTAIFLTRKAFPALIWTFLL